MGSAKMIYLIPFLFFGQTLAAGKAIIDNRCDYDVNLKITPGCDVGQAQPADRPLLKIGAHTPKAYDIEELPCKSCGMSMKLTKHSEILMKGAYGNDVLQYEYSTTSGKLSYDMSFVDCYADGTWGNCLAREGGIQIYSSLDIPGACGPYSCPADTTEKGTLLCLAGYNIPEPENQPVQMCSTLDEDLILVLCSINPKSSGLDYPDMPAIPGDTESSAVAYSSTAAAYSSSVAPSSSSVYTPPVVYSTPTPSPSPSPSSSSVLTSYTPVVSIKQAAQSSKPAAVLALVHTEVVYVTEHKTVFIDAPEATPHARVRRHKHRSPHNKA